MFRMFFSLSVKGASSLVLLVGLASFALVFGALIVFAPVWAAAVIPTISETALTAVLAAVIAQFAMSLTGAMLTRRQSREIEQTRTAIDSMAQGPCMFDAAERLVVCNAPYYKMYELTPADVKPGSTLSEVVGETGRQGHVLSRSAGIPQRISDRGWTRAHHRARSQVQGRPSFAGHKSSHEGRRLDRHARGHHRAAAGRAATHDHATSGRAPRRHRKRDLGVPRACRKSSANGGRQRG